jgi:hypothetical protein
MLLKIVVLRRNSRKEFLATSRLLSHAGKKNTYTYIIYLFVIAYVVNRNVTVSISLFPCTSNIIKMFAELGRLC